MTTIDDTIDDLLQALLGLDADGHQINRASGERYPGSPCPGLDAHFARSRTLLLAFAGAVIAEARRPEARPRPPMDPDAFFGKELRVYGPPVEKPAPTADPLVVDGHCAGECGELASECECSEKPAPIEPGDRFRDVETREIWRCGKKTAETTWRLSGDDYWDRFEVEAHLLDPKRYERLPREPRPGDAAPSELTAMPLRTGGIDPDAARAAMPELERRIAEPEPLTGDELAAIEARCEAATKGCWFADESADGERMPDGSGGIDGYFENGTILAEPTDDEDPPVIAEGVATFEDRLFIISARSDVPRLVAEVRRLREGNASLVDKLRIARAERDNWIKNAGKAEAIAATWERQFQDLDAQARRDRVNLGSEAAKADADANRTRAVLADLLERLTDAGDVAGAALARKAIADAATAEPDPVLPAGWRWEGCRIDGGDETPLCLYQRIEDRGNYMVACAYGDGTWFAYEEPESGRSIADGIATPRPGETALDAGKREALLALKRAGKLGA